MACGLWLQGALTSLRASAVCLSAQHGGGLQRLDSVLPEAVALTRLQWEEGAKGVGAR